MRSSLGAAFGRRVFKSRGGEYEVRISTLLVGDFFPWLSCRRGCFLCRFLQAEGGALLALFPQLALLVVPLSGVFILFP